MSLNSEKLVIFSWISFIEGGFLIKEGPQYSELPSHFDLNDDPHSASFDCVW